MRSINKANLSTVWSKAQALNSTVTSATEPTKPCNYMVWRVLDPVLLRQRQEEESELKAHLASHPDTSDAEKADMQKALTNPQVAVRVYMPFNEALSLVDGIDAKLVKAMPGTGAWMTVFTGGNSAEYESLVPELDLCHRPEFRHVLKLLSLLNCHNETGRGRGYYAFGEAGTGKTSSALWVAAVLGLPVVQFNCSEVTEVDDLFVRQIPDDGKWISTDGALLRAVKHNWLCLVDELDLAPASLPPALNDLIEAHAFSVPGFKDMVVKAQAGFHLIACGNTGFSGSEAGLYNGRNIIDSSFKSRCIVDKFDELDKETIKQMIIARYQKPAEDGSTQEIEGLAESIASFSVNINALMKKEGIADTFSPRSILFMDTLIENLSVLKSPLVYALATALPLMQEDENFRQAAWTTFVAQMPELVASANDFDRIWSEMYEPA